MLRLLRRTLALRFCCFLLLHGKAGADEDALWGPTPSRDENPPESKQSWFWTPSLPKLPSLPFHVPFFGSSEDENDEVAVTTTPKGLTESFDQELFEGSGNSEASETPVTSRAIPIAVTTIRTDSLPTGSSDSPQDNNATLVPHSHSPTASSFRVSAKSPTSAPATQAATHSHPQPPGTTQATGPGTHATARQLLEEHTDKTTNILSTIPPETTVPTALTWSTAQTTSTTSSPLMETTTRTTRHPARPINPTTFVRLPQDFTASTLLYADDATVFEVVTTDRSTTFEARPGSVKEEQPGSITTSSSAMTTVAGIDHKSGWESITGTTPRQKVNFPTAGDLPGPEEEEEEEVTTAAPSAGGGVGDSERFGDVSTPSTELLTTPQARSTDLPPETLYTEDWFINPLDSSATFLPDCNQERSGICNLSDAWDASTRAAVASDTRPTQNATAANQSINPFLIPAPPMLVPLYTDWNSAMAAWGLAWEAHVYGTGCIFAMLTIASALNLLCLPLRCPSGCGYFALVSLFLLAAGCTRSFTLLYDAYGHQDRLAFTEASLMLYEAPFPCLTAAFGLVFLLLSMRSRMQLSYSTFQRPCFLACLVVLHFAAAFGPVTLFKFYQQKPPSCVSLSLVSRGAFVVLATFLSGAYFVFYIYVRADSKHIYHLNNTSPTPAERYNRCPFAESRDWDRAAITVCLSALFSLACAGLQFYAMLNALGVAGGEEVFHPWPWWAFQFSCRLCELGVCLTLALVVAQPVYCSDHLPDAGSCWTELLASKSPILPGTYQWTLSQEEKLAIVDTVGLRETESLPLYTLMDERIGSSLNGLDLLYHSNRALAYRDLDLNLESEKTEEGLGREPSGSSFTSDSTTDLRPPSPINLRRSIDEALFSEALFPMSLFNPTKPIRLSDLSIKNPCATLCDPVSADPGLYRTSSCLEMASQPKTHPKKSQAETIVGAPPSPSLTSSSNSSSPERWRDSSSSCSLYRASLGGSSLVLCPSPERRAGPTPNQVDTGIVASSSHQTLADPQRRYQTLGTTSQESLDLDMSSEADRSVQEEFINACRQVDSLSVCSETIDL